METISNSNKRKFDIEYDCEKILTIIIIKYIIIIKTIQQVVILLYVTIIYILIH